MKKICAALLISSGIPFAMAQADDTDVLKLRLAQLPQFEAQFNQQAFDFDNNLVQQSAGHVALQAPLKFVWEQRDPEPLQLISDGEAVWFYDPYVEQVTVSNVDDAISQTPLSLLSSQDPAIWARWNVVQAQECFTLTDTQASDVQMQVCFNDEVISKLQLVDAQGTRTTMLLTDFTTELAQSSQFHFTPPEGTYIDDQRHQ
ncbi:outer membrane lipoprotein chaperone LolA [Ferrimonas pelagia]|uniref:Outer-membrane lipoprotein carrier protein n=1 Tax=Ferrimonas pelagia TaxID=1177826 RepID=A0ABP9FJX6_9GAMM